MQRERRELLVPTLANLYGLELRFKAQDSMTKNEKYGKYTI